jgi:CBS domain containing-hemolysin-like protein
MIPRLKMVTFDISRPPVQLAALFRQTHLTKLPVYDENIDNIIGVVYAKSFLLDRPEGERDVRPFVRPVLFVPEMMRLDRLLRIFREEHRQLAMVVDEFGGIAGLISLEDVVEQLIGEIYEPGDVNIPNVVEIGPGQWLIPGDLTIRDYPELFGQRTRQSRSATPAGLIYSALHRLPKIGDRVQIGNVELMVENMRQGRVTQVRVRIGASSARSGGHE